MDRIEPFTARAVARALLAAIAMMVFAQLTLSHWSPPVAWLGASGVRYPHARVIMENAQRLLFACAVFLGYRALMTAGGGLLRVRRSVMLGLACASIIPVLCVAYVAPDWYNGGFPLHTVASFALVGAGAAFFRYRREPLSAGQARDDADTRRRWLGIFVCAYLSMLALFSLFRLQGWGATDFAWFVEFSVSMMCGSFTIADIVLDMRGATRRSRP